MHVTHYIPIYCDIPLIYCQIIICLAVVPPIYHSKNPLPHVSFLVCALRREAASPNCRNACMPREIPRLGWCRRSFGEVNCAKVIAAETEKSHLPEKKRLQVAVLYVFLGIFWIVFPQRESCFGYFTRLTIVFCEIAILAVTCPEELEGQQNTKYYIYTYRYIYVYIYTYTYIQTILYLTLHIMCTYAD